ncbi:hypothetical protein BRCH_03828c [Candidatus Burkholderia brachyanthoides]|nr:hypothetical protein BRCH_03828c [Candidatus Burkholderia brachyanthoides]
MSPVCTTVMDLLWVFAIITPVAIAMLFAFAARIDLVSGRWRASDQVETGQREIARARPFPAHCLQQITIERFLIFAPKMPPTKPPAVAPLSASFEITS